MFTYVKLKNFLSFGDVIFNFKKNKNTPKNFIAIYGENGSGKSNFVRSIDLLYKSLISFDRASKADEIYRVIKENEKDIPVKVIQNIIDESDMQKYLESCRMINCEEPTEIEYGFMLDGYEGIYTISFNKKIIKESLYYFTGKQRGYLFDISTDENDNIIIKLWNGLFLSTTEKKETVDDILKYWGKHTLLGIIVHKLSERNENYNKENLSPYLLKVISSFFNTTVIMKKSNTQNSGIIRAEPKKILRNLASGTIKEDLLYQLKYSESILNDFFTQTYADIKNISYDIKHTENNMIVYQLYVDKIIAGKIRHISFNQESAGTQQVLHIVRMLLGLFCGVTVVFDEIDTGIHDILLTNILNSMMDDITGQLIITTHNTMLLEKIEAHNAYIIQVDYEGNKAIRCLDEFNIQEHHNIRSLYLKGLFGGIPFINGIDFSNIIDIIENNEEEK